MRRRLAKFTAVAAGSGAAVGAAATLLVVLSVVDPILNHRFLNLIAAAFLVLSMVLGATTYRYVRSRLIRRKEWWQA